MLKTRVIPVLLWDGRKLVKGRSFEAWRGVGTAEQAVRLNAARGVDELVLLDITATREGRGPNVDFIASLAAICDMPFTVGGGIRNVDDVRALLLAGADKVVIGTAALRDPSLISVVAAFAGSQCAVASVDYRLTPDGPRVWVASGTQETDKDPVAWAEELERMGAGEILLTCIDHEGTMEGYDVGTLRLVADAVRIPVIASGGAGSYAHMADAMQAGASAVSAGAMFQFTECTPLEASRFLHDAGFPARIA